MYTQCPECGVAFRVTAEVLKMAAGKVRCGGCGIAFNALEHLSEQKPIAPAGDEKAPDSDVPELKPDIAGELEADTPPQTVSAEQSAALLQTLDQLAGEDIRIEDTGVEWRVFDNDEVEDDEPDDQPDAEAALELISDTGSMKFIIEGEDDAPADEAILERAPDEPAHVIDEMRFDDDTVLPDDFDEVVVAPSPARPVEAAPPEPEPEPEAPQIDLDLSEPDEWEDLLGDFAEPAAEADVVEEEILETAGEGGDEESGDDPIVFAEAPSVEEEMPDDPLDMDTQFALQAEAMGIDLSGIHETAEEEDEDVHEEPETSIEEDLMAAAFETEAADQVVEEADFEEALAENLDDDLEESLDESLEDEDEEDVAENGEVEEVSELEIDLQAEDEDEAEDDVEDIALTFDDEVEEMIETLSMSMDDEPDVDVETSSDEHTVPEMTEEEKTLNRMIDQELLNISVEDEDGFASTIVQQQPNREIDEEIAASENKPEEKKKDKKSEPPLSVETIVMEGESIRAKLDKEHLTDDAASPEPISEPGFSIALNKAKDDYARRREMTGGGPGAGIYAGIAALVLLLVVQAVHQSREALATVPAFSSAVGPIYRMVGKPLTPTWDIAGWRFEARRDAFDDAANRLTIISRIGNTSGKPLPYPLINVTLTDRFEETIGNKTLDPGEYLSDDLDPRTLVQPGNNFTAVMSIEGPSEAATGYKLQACYRLPDAYLRCHIPDFK